MKKIFQKLAYGLPLLLFIGMFLQCTENQSDTTKKTETETKVVSDSVASPEWFCSAIERYPADANSAQRAVGGKNKFWQTGTVLRIGFIGGTASQIAAVKQYAPEWVAPGAANLTFSYPTSGPYDIRVAFNPSGGAWSYVGIDAKLETNQNKPTINLGWIGRDVICHEFGHALGLFHEHQNPNGGICFNEANVIASLSGPPNNWSVAQIRFNVLDKLNANDVLTTPWDRVSVMHYNIPSSWTCNGVGIPGGVVISQTDKDFIRARYPGTVVVPPVTSVTLTSTQIDEIVTMLNTRQTEIDTTAARWRSTSTRIRTILKR